MDTEREEQIRARAHEIWEEEGRPEGREEEHWRRAAQELVGNDQADEAVDVGASSGLHPGGTLPAGGHKSEGSIGTGGGSTAGDRTGSHE